MYSHNRNGIVFCTAGFRAPIFFFMARYTMKAKAELAFFSFCLFSSCLCNRNYTLFHIGDNSNLRQFGEKYNHEQLHRSTASFLFFPFFLSSLVFLIFCSFFCSPLTFLSLLDLLGACFLFFGLISLL